MNKKSIDFIGIGAPRSGSSWLAQCLYEHPAVVFPHTLSNEKLHPLDKELNFFSQALFRHSFSQPKRYKKGMNWYLDQFDWNQPQRKRGEFSVSYLADPKAPNRIKKHFPHIKILVILRNPIKMVYSSYFHLKALVHTKVPQDFDQAVEKGKFEKLRINWGKYYTHLNKYFHLFSDKNIKVVLLDEVKQKLQQTISQVYQFLEVNPSFVPPSLFEKQHCAVTTRYQMLKKLGYNLLQLLEKLRFKDIHHTISRNRRLYLAYQNLNLIPFKYPRMHPKTEKILKKIFLTEIEQLEQLINKDLSNWK